MTIFQKLAEQAVLLALPFLEQEGWKAVPEESKPILAVVFSCGETEFKALVAKTSTKLDDALLELIWTDIKEYCVSKGVAYATLPETLDSFVKLS